MNTSKITDAILGVAIGDAVGVPFEFRSRKQMDKNPAKGLVGYGTHNQPAGTWSDDTSLTLCLAESLINGYDLKDIATKFIQWKNTGYWTARGQVFDIGITTAKAISRLQRQVKKDDIEEIENQRYYADEFDNGNGSLMRILPMLAYIIGKPTEVQFDLLWKVSALTHGHIRSAMSCLIYIKLLEHIYYGSSKDSAYLKMRNDIIAFWEEISFAENERSHFERIILDDVRNIHRSALKSGGYVIEVLESSIHQFLTYNSYEESILSIVNLGHDTDTSAAITGGLAGMYYRRRGIPEYWLVSLARMEDIIGLGNRLSDAYGLD